MSEQRTLVRCNSCGQVFLLPFELGCISGPSTIYHCVCGVDVMLKKIRKCNIWETEIFGGKNDD